MTRRVISIALWLPLLLVALPTYADTASRGLRWPGASVVESDDAAALSMNPAGLGFLQGFDARYVHTTLETRAGQGDGLFLAGHVLGPLALGAAFEFVPSLVVDERVMRFTFGTALGFGRTFALGLNLHSFVADRDTGVDGLLSLDLGLLWRPTWWLATGIAVNDLNTPVLRGRPLHRTYEAGLAFRPATDRVVIGTEVRVEQDSWDTDAVLRLAFEPLAGLVVGTEATLGPRDDALEVSIAAHLSLSMGWFGATGGAFFGGADGVDYDGFTVGVRASTKAHRALYRTHGHAVVLTLAGDPPNVPSGGFLSTRRSTFAELVVALDSLRDEPRVDAVVLKLRGFEAGWAEAEELRAVLADLRAAGKKVIVHVVSPDTREYYLATESDRLVIDPSGGLLLTGLVSTSTYFYDALSAIGVSAEFVAIGKYKSFPEMFTRTGPTAPAREAQDRILDGILAELLAGMARGRNVTVDKMRALLDGGPYVAATAREAGLVDAVAFVDELDAEVATAAGAPLTLRDDWFEPRERDGRWGSEQRVAVVTIEGSIVDGESASFPLVGKLTGGDTIVRALESASKDPSIAGILVRVDSGGGSSTASDQMHRAVVRAAAEKPLVVSFGNVAASGGYYLACGAPRILASPTTVTGSIGIFTGKFVFRDLLAKLGIARDLNARGQHATILSPDRPWSDEERALLESRMRALYDLFVQRVAEGRKLKVEEVEPIAQGRVWLGSDALERRLVDERGGVREALQYLNEQADRAPRAYLALAYYPAPGLLARLGFGASAAAPGAVVEEPEADLVGRVPPALRPFVQALAPLLAGYADGQPLALLPVHYDIR